MTARADPGRAARPHGAANRRLRRYIGLGALLLCGTLGGNVGASVAASGVVVVDNTERHERLVEQVVTYTLLKDGRFYIIEDVPARVDVDTGEQYFVPHTVERLQQIVWEKRNKIGDPAPENRTIL